MVAEDFIRVGIRWDVKSADIISEKPFEIENMTTKKILSRPAETCKVTARRIGKDKWRFKMSESGYFFQVGEHRYRGNLIVIPSDGKISVANELKIDDYLKGVLPREVIVTWPDEALRVQAVASRTYLASHLGKHAAFGFDLCSDVHCQVYGGMTKEHPKTSAAVDKTRGEILAYEGKPIGAYFFAHCGGSTEQIGPVWGNQDVPYLPRKACTFCSDNPRYIWKLKIHNHEIMKALLKVKLVKGKTLKEISVKKKSGSGRASMVTVTTDAGEFDMTGNAFRLALHPEKIRSTLWTRFAKLEGFYEFEGKGWGHGVGMCQWGARGQADKGRQYREILDFYYPHTQLIQWQR